MYRKRKNVSPHFRMPVPYDPVTGRDHILSPNRPFCRFTLNAALSTADDRQDATITHQYGPGSMHSYSNKIIVFNMETKRTGVYAFSGQQDDAGIAAWDKDNNWLILCMLSEGLRGGCLAENHKGRGEVFKVYLGTWDCDSHKWSYDTETEYQAIDWRYDVPYPDAGATGLFQPRCSSTYGIIWETVALDCDSPGPCGE